MTLPLLSKTSGSLLLPLLLCASLVHAQEAPAPAPAKPPVSFKDYPSKKVFFVTAGLGENNGFDHSSPGWSVGFLESGFMPRLGEINGLFGLASAFEAGGYISYRKFSTDYSEYYWYGYEDFTVTYTQISFGIKGLMSLNPVLHLDPGKAELLIGGSTGYDLGLVSIDGYGFPGAGAFVAPHLEGRLWLGRLGLTGAIGRKATGLLNVGLNYNFHKD